jgi:phytoene synthase
MTHESACSFAYCERLARRQAANFYPAFRVLPGPQRRAMCALYAFMRVTDDLGDEPGPVEDKRSALEAWRRQFDLALAGDFQHPVHAALIQTLQTYDIPRLYLDAVIDGVEMDLSQTRYNTFADLYPYCYRVASAVGLACIHIWGFRAERAKSYAEAAGIAFQLTNILRDLREDALCGRVYLPQEDLRRFGYRNEQLQAGDRDEAFRALMRFEVERARSYYKAGRPLAGLLPPAGRAVYQVMQRTYQGLLDVIEERDYDVFSSRVSLSRWRKLGLVVQAMPVRLGWV